jgi:hypothetical protein
MVDYLELSVGFKWYWGYSLLKTLMRSTILTILIGLSIALPAVADPPVIESGTWKSFSANTPYSQLVTERDAFYGDSQVVYDHEYDGNAFGGRQTGLITKWSARTVAAYFYKYRDVCAGTSNHCGITNDVIQPDTMLIKVGDKILTLEGQQGFFKLSPSDMAFLASVAPTQPLVRVTMGGERFDTPIGMGTVNLWKTLYAVPESASIAPISVPK